MSNFIHGLCKEYFLQYLQHNSLALSAYYSNTMLAIYGHRQAIYMFHWVIA
jgi:hypothetical protein